MRYFDYPVEVKSAVAAGASRDVRDLRDKYLQIGGTFVATLSIEITLDGANWFAIASGLNAPGVTPVPQACRSVRVRTTAYTSGTPVAQLAGWDDNG